MPMIKSRTWAYACLRRWSILLGNAGSVEQAGEVRAPSAETMAEGQKCFEHAYGPGSDGCAQ